MTASFAMRYAMLSPNTDGCLIWSWNKDKDGYGKHANHMAHRLAYELHVGQIPIGFEVDHICWVRACVNPNHLRILTRLANRQRQRSAIATVCKNGHELTPNNVYFRPGTNGQRDCRVCIRARVKKYRNRVRRFGGRAA